jgi:hypothetical protein
MMHRPRRCPAAHPPPPCQVLFPVVDSVLGQITQEYEKRLLQKDHELTSARERAAAAQREALELAVGFGFCALPVAWVCVAAAPLVPLALPNALCKGAF